VNYFTSARNHTDVDVTRVLESGVGRGGILSTGHVNVASKVWGWRRHWGSKVVDMGTLSLPPLEYATRAVWLDVPPEVQTEVEALDAAVAHAAVADTVAGDRLGAVASGAVASDNVSSDDAGGGPGRRGLSTFLKSVHGLNHVLSAVAPLFVLSDGGDIGTEHARSQHSRRPRPPRVMLFDCRPGGVGIAQAVFQRGPAVLAKALEVVESCPCLGGCLGCILLGHCANENLDKRATALLARRLLERLRPTPEPENGGGGGGDVDGAAEASCSAAPPFVSTAADLEGSPVRRRRLGAAREMGAARAKGAAVRRPWTSSLEPEYKGMCD